MGVSGPSGALATPRAASTVILVRGTGEAAPEVLLMKRSASARFMPNAYVFAGGAVDVEDTGAEAYERSHNLDDRTASATLDLPSDGLGYYVAAARESFEECGLLLASEATGDLVDLGGWTAGDIDRARREVGSGVMSLGHWCRTQGWYLALDRLVYFAHWVTPEGMPRRFDTRFFIARAPVGQVASLAGDEMAELIWRTPHAALADHASGSVLLMKATRAILSELAGFGDVDSLFAFAQGPRKITVVRPLLGVDP